MPPLRKATRSAGARRSVAETRREAVQTAKGRCEFVDHQTKRVCGSTYQVQIDHIMPKAIGGSDDQAEINLGLKANNWKQ